MVVTEQRLEKALCMLAESDAQFAELKGAVMRSEYLAECAESLAYKQLQGTVEDRKREVKLIPEVKAAWEEFFRITVEMEKLKAFRQRNVIVIDLYRTQEASRRVGNVQ
jgi:hypothetical protein